MTHDASDPIAALSGSATLRDRPTAAGFVAGALRSAIRDGSLRDGTELSQTALAEHFGVSRVPVREAMRALEAEGWIRALPHRRAIVQAVSPSRVAQTFEIRAVLEAHMLERAIASMTPERFARLEAICDTMDHMTDHHAWVKANREFDRVLLEAAGAELALELVDQLASQVERYLHRGDENAIRTSRAGNQHQSEAGSERRAILDAVKAKEIALARALLVAHIQHTAKRVLAALTERDLTTEVR